MSDTTASSPNELLAALPAAVLKRVLGQCEPVELVAGSVLIEPGELIRNVLFPLDSFVSLIAPIGNGEELEVGMVGNEGLHGASLALGVSAAPLRAIVQGAGQALQLNAALFSKLLVANKALRVVVNRYIYVQLSQFAQTGACARFHFVEARLARWLLMTRDRAHSNDLLITHQFLAYMLGVRRVGVTRAASALQRHGLIRYRRGSIRIVNTPGLEDAACSCYVSAKETYARVLG